MRITCAALVLCVGSMQSAVAAEPNCRSIESTSGRLACYDASFPPPKRERAASEDDRSRAAYKDPFVIEDARMRNKLNNICRGC